MKISLIVTVFNEQKTITTLLQSIEVQSQPPDEVIIVDAGSTDKTVQLIKQFQKTSQLKIKLFTRLGNRAIGRNYAVKKAIGQGIAVTDAGCILNKNWLKRIAAPLINKKADAVAGFYQMKTDTLFTQSSAPFVGTMSHNISKDFLPSSRSLAFTKQAWKKVGGYPETLDFAEDLVFSQKLKDQSSVKMITEPKAIVEWSPPQNIFEFFTSLKNYTLGNVQARYQRHLKKNLLVVIRYSLLTVLLAIFILTHKLILLIILVSLAFIYFLYTSIKFAPHLRHLLAPNLIFILQLTADIAVLTGLLAGLVKLVRDSTLQTRPQPARN